MFFFLQTYMQACFSDLCCLIFSVEHTLPLAYHTGLHVLSVCWWNPYEACLPPMNMPKRCYSVPGIAVWQTAGHGDEKIRNVMRVYVYIECVKLPEPVWIITQRLCAMQWINVAQCQATANIFASLIHISHTLFFSFHFFFCLAVFTKYLHC